jgi:hypothetical protein
MKETDIYCRVKGRERLRKLGLEPEKVHEITEYINKVVKSGLRTRNER